QSHEGVALGAVLVGRGVLRGLDPLEIAGDLPDQIVETVVEAVGIGLFTGDLPGDLPFSVVHGPAPPDGCAASRLRTSAGRPADEARWSIMVDGPGCVRHSAAREEAPMRDPRDLYGFESADVLAAVPRTGLTLVHALPGVVDAGNACRIAGTYLRDELRHLRLVSFDVDELLDYRGSRPQAVFDGASYTSVRIPDISLSLMYDEGDRPFLFLDGPEPDLQWRRLSEALIDLIEYFDVQRVVGMQAVPTAVPHTRP